MRPAQIPAQLDEAIAAVCPIKGVSLGSESDRSTWTIHFADDATAAQRAEALAALAAFQYRDPVPRDEVQEQIDFIRWVVDTPPAQDAPDIDVAEQPAPVEEVVSPLEVLETDLTRLQAKIDAVRAGTQELTPDELISMHRDDPPGAVAKLEDAVRALKGEARRKLNELMNVELAELRNLRGMAGEDVEREQAIEYCLGLFSRLGDPT